MLVREGRLPGARLWGVLGFVLAFALSLVLLNPQGAGAATSFSYVGVFGSSGSGDLEFDAAQMPKRAAVHHASGKLFIADHGNDRVQVFSPTADGVVFEFSVATDTPIGLAIDPSTADLYVSNMTEIKRFNAVNPSDPTGYTLDAGYTSPAGIGALHQSSGAGYPAKGGLAVDPDDSSLIVADVGQKLVKRFDTDGTLISSFDGCDGEIAFGLCFGEKRSAFFNTISDLAVTSTGDIIVADISGAQARVDRYSGDGATIHAVLSVNNNPVTNQVAADSGVSVGVDPASDEVFVSSVNRGFFGAVNPTRVFQFAEDELVGYFALPSAPNLAGLVYGIAAGGQPGRLYVVGATSVPWDFSGFPPRVHAYDAILPAEVEMTSVTGVGERSATFKGKINPRGSEARWTFRYRIEGETEWAQIPVTPEDIGPAGTDLDVEKTVETLAPNSDYEVQLVGSVGEIVSTSDLLHFTTDSAAPDVEWTAGNFLDAETATLYGAMRTNNADVTYRFEWGTDDSYGNIARVGGGKLEAGQGEDIVKAEITGLEPEMTYHFRLVAENEFEQLNESDDQTFTTLSESRKGFRDERGFEVVTHTPTDGMVVLSGQTTVSLDGDGVDYLFSVTQSVPPGYELPHKTFMAERGDDGWQARPIDVTVVDVYEFNYPAIPSPDFSRVVVDVPNRLDADDTNEVRDLYRMEPGGEATWLSRSLLVPRGQPQPEHEGGTADSRFGNPDVTLGLMSDDGGVVTFTSRRSLVTPGVAGLYKATGTATTLISVDEHGDPVGGVVSARAISTDGSKVAWTTAVNLAGVDSKAYVQIDGRPTIAAGPGSVVGANRDLSILGLFDAGAMYTVRTDTGLRARVDAGVNVSRAIRMSGDGSRLFYASNDAIPGLRSPLGKRPVAGGDNVYVALIGADGQLQGTRFIASTAGDGATEVRSAVNPDGSVFTFGSRNPITGQPTGGFDQVFVYDEAARSLACASCPAAGSAPPTAHVNRQLSVGSIDIAVGADLSWHGPGTGTNRRYVAADGTVFFSTTSRLVAEDVNDFRDVYEYRGGMLRLITRGSVDDGYSAFEDADPDGTTVALTTGAYLDPRDLEPGSLKVYAARLGGGFPDPPVDPAGCEGDGCQGAVTRPPNALGVSSSGLAGDGNVVAERAARRRAAINVRRMRPVRGSAARLRVRVPGAGRIALRGPLIRSAARRAPRAGAFAVRAVLKPRARRALARRQKLRSSVRVVFRGSDGGRVVRQARVTFHAPVRKGR